MNCHSLPTGSCDSVQRVYGKCEAVGDTGLGLKKNRVVSGTARGTAVASVPEVSETMNPNAHGSARPAEAQRPRARRLDAWILSGDDSFLLELGPALGERFRTRPVDDAADVEPVGTTPWLAIIDGGRADTRALVAGLTSRHALAPLIIVVPPGEGASWGSALARGDVVATVGRDEIASPRFQEAVAAAEARLGASTPTPLRTNDAGARPPAFTLPNRWVLLLVPVLLIGAAVAWWLSRAPAPSSAPGTAVATRPAGPARGAERTAVLPGTSPAPAAGEAAAPRRSLDELLSAAREAFSDQNRLLPRPDAIERGSSALELYGQALTIDPQNEEARDGLRRLFSIARSRMQADLSAGRLDEAERLLALFKSAGVAAADMRTLESDLSAAKPKWLVAQIRRALGAGDVAAADQYLSQLGPNAPDRATQQELRRALDALRSNQQLSGLAAKVHAAIESGALLEPAADSARAQLQAMRQIDRTGTSTLAAQKELQAALLARARDAIRAQQADAATRWVTAAGEYGALPEIADLKRQIQSETETAAARAAPPPPPPPAATPAPPPAAPSFVAARPLRPLNVAYPSAASALGQQGYAIVEFTLNSDGTPTDIGVVDSTKGGVFDRAAIDAVRRGRYDTDVLGPARAPRRARIRIVFKPS